MKYNDNGTVKDIKVKAFDTLPVGTEVDYDGSVVPDGWMEVDDPNTYSTDEKRIGTWIDGKPLYRIVLQFPNGTQSTDLVNYTLSNYGITNVDTIFIVHPSYYSLGNARFPFQYNDGNAFECNVNPTTLAVKLGYNQIANSPFLITLEYTKTTD